MRTSGNESAGKELCESCLVAQHEQRLGGLTKGGRLRVSQRWTKMISF